MIQCSQCGTVSPPDANFWYQCGANFSRRAPAKDDQRSSPLVSTLSPFEVEPLHLSLAALEWLNDSGHISIAPTSPFGFLLVTQPHTTTQERLAARTEFAARGVMFDDEQIAAPQYRAPEGEMLRRSIGMLGKPKSRLRISIVTPQKRPLVIPLFLSEQFAALGYFDPQNFQLGAPIPLPDLVSILIRQLEIEPSRGCVPPTVAWSTHLRLATLLWHRAGQRVEQDPSLEHSVHLLAQAGMDARQRMAAIASLIGAGVANESQGKLTLNAPYNDFLDSLWSGHFFELETTALQSVSTEDMRIRASTKRLLFVGPVGRCFVVGSKAVDPKEKKLSHSEVGEVPKASAMDKLVGFECLAPSRLEALLRRFVGLGASAK